MSRPPILVVVLGAAFLLLMTSLVIGSFATPEFPPYTPTIAAPREVGAALVGPGTYTIDASVPDRWRRFDFSRDAVVDTGAWDIAFRRTHVAAARGVGIRDLGPVPFDSVTHLPEDGYLVAAAARDSSHPAIGKWYDYNYLSHLLTSRRHVYAVRTSDGRYAMFEILGYYCREIGTACLTFRYAYQGDGTPRVVRTQEKGPRGPGT